MPVLAEKTDYNFLNYKVFCNFVRKNGMAEFMMKLELLN